MKRKSLKFSLKKQYSESWKYLKESSKFIWIIIGIFFLFAIFGFLVPIPETLSNSIMDYLKEIVSKTEDLSSFGMIKFIFLNNIQSSFFGMILGVFLGIFSVFASALNGFVVGFVASMSVSNLGFSSLWKLFPHGIFELPAIFISLGLGLKLGTFVFKDKPWKFLQENLIKSVKLFLLIILPLLIIAAIIEGILIGVLS